MKPLAPAMLVAILLTGCATRPLRQPEPIIRTVEVKVPVPQPCPALQRIRPAPAYPDTAKAIQGAADIFERVKLLLAGRELRIAREASAEAAMGACG